MTHSLVSWLRRRWMLGLLAAVMLMGASMTPAVAVGGFRNPLNPGPDPTLMYANGQYYLGTTQGDAIRIWHSPSLGTLSTAQPVEVWRDSDPSRNQQVWAPFFERFQQPEGPRWFLYYTASNGVDAMHRMYALRSAGDDPLGPYRFMGKVADLADDRWAIDGIPFVHDGRMYFVWSGQRDDGVGNQLFVAPMSNPWTISGSRVYLPADGGCPEVREAPSTIHHAGRTFLVYSACDTGKPDYQLWMKSIADGRNPLDPNAWFQHPRAVFTRNDAAGVFGPGSNSFFKSPDGREDWIAYHAKDTSAYTYDRRTTRAQPFTWNPDGTPSLGSPVSLTTTLPLPSGDPGTP
jgi:GH43 family beta-xylosidase